MMPTDTRTNSGQRTPLVRYPLSTDGMGAGSGGLSFEEFAYFYALENGIVQPEGMQLELVGRPGGRPAMNQLVLNREVDIGVISLATAVRVLDRGVNLRVLCKEKRFEGGGNSLYARASSPIASAKDLRSARGISFHCEPQSERLIVQRAILEKKYDLKWSELALVEGS